MVVTGPRTVTECSVESLTPKEVGEFKIEKHMMVDDFNVVDEPESDYDVYGSTPMASMSFSAVNWRDEEYFKGPNVTSINQLFVKKAYSPEFQSYVVRLMKKNTFSVHGKLLNHTFLDISPLELPEFINVLKYFLEEIANTPFRETIQTLKGSQYSHITDKNDELFWTSEVARGLTSNRLKLRPSRSASGFYSIRQGLHCLISLNFGLTNILISEFSTHEKRQDTLEPMTSSG